MCEEELKAYNSFRTGYTFFDIYQMLWVNSDDPKDWPKASASAKDGIKKKRTAGRRHSVLGFWRQLKLEMWENMKKEFGNEFWKHQ